MGHEFDHVFIEMALVLVSTALLSWASLLLRQPIVVAYFLCGMVLGPHALGWIGEAAFIDAAGLVGIVLLLFHAGLVLHPSRLKDLFKQTLLLTVVNCIISSAAVMGVFRLFGLQWSDSFYAGLALMFSSTILVIKLLPTTALHHQRMGSYCIAILIAQDLIAIGLLVYIEAAGEGAPLIGWLMLPVKAVALVVGTFMAEQYIIRRMMRMADRFHETLYILALGWCLGIAVLAEYVGLSYEVGAFIAGVALARSPLSLFLSEGLKPFRDFFLVFFFFILGARLNPAALGAVVLPALVGAVILMAIKFYSFRTLFRVLGEKVKFSREAGWRLAQASEFSLIVAVAERADGLFSETAYQLVQLTAVITLILSSYLVVFFFPSPLGFRKGLKQD